MNGIIHPCSHPNDDDVHFRITEEKIYENIFNYIEVCLILAYIYSSLNIAYKVDSFACLRSCSYTA